MEKKLYTADEIENMGNWKATRLLMDYEDNDKVEEYFNKMQFMAIKTLLYKRLKENGLITQG